MGRGTASALHWSGSRRAVDFFDLKGVVELIAAGMGSAIDCSPAEHAFLVRGRTANVIAGGPNGESTIVGLIGQLAPSLAAARDIPVGSELYVAELDLDALMQASTGEAMAAVPPPRQPSVIRDISMVVDDVLPAKKVRGTIRAAAPATLVDVREFDRYQGRGVPEGRVSLSYRLTFRAPDRTLTDAEVQRAMDDILRALAAEHRAVQR